VAGAAQEPPPIRDTVTKALAEFKKTHHDTWAATRAAFSDAQWDTLTDLAVAPSYFV
jgi:proteasome activator subunit 4